MGRLILRQNLRVVCYGHFAVEVNRRGTGTQPEIEKDRMVDIIPRRNLESGIKRVLFVEPQSGYSTGFNDTVRVETLGPEYLAASVQDTVECQLADLRTPGADLT